MGPVEHSNAACVDRRNCRRIRQRRDRADDGAGLAMDLGVQQPLAMVEARGRDYVVGNHTGVIYVSNPQNPNTPGVRDVLR